MVLALRREVMYQGAVRDLITCRNSGRRGIGILDVPLAVQFLKSDAQAAKVGIGKQGCVSGNLQTIGNDLGGFAAGLTGHGDQTNDQMALDTIIGPLGN